MEKWICQTFWTKPMPKENLINNVNIAAISLYYAHRSGYLVKMYTDSFGKELLSDLEYDSIVTDLDEIPNDIPPKIFAYSKAIALKKEPLGVIHTDFDVFLKKNCLDPFYEGGYDCALQNIEYNSAGWGDYSTGREFFKKYDGFDELKTHMITCNVGVIGFKNSVMKDIYLNSYFEYVEFFKDKVYDCNFVMDLFFEQISIHYIIETYNFNSFYVLPQDGTPDLNRIAQQKGYQHIYGGYKSTKDGRRFLKDLKDKLYAYKKYNVKKVWACPCAGTTTYIQKDNNNHCIDFNEYKKQHNYDSSIDKNHRILFELFNDVCKEYDNASKIIICSDIELLGAFYQDFDIIYGLDFKTQIDRITKRKKGKKITKPTIETANEIYGKLNFIQKYNLKNINFLGKNEYLEHRANELIDLLKPYR